MEQTLLTIKPDAIEDRHVGEIISIIEKNGITIKKIKMETFSKERAGGFYRIHRDQPFFGRLIEFMVSGPIIAIVLEHNNCVEYVREILGATDPKEAAEGTIRQLFARNVTHNAVHASDSIENAKTEISFIFGE